jgi:hypothetical protein
MGMKAHHIQAGVQEQGCVALYNLSFNAKVAGLIAVGGGVQVLEAASTYPYAEDALDKIRTASIPKVKLSNDSANNREGPIKKSPYNNPTRNLPMNPTRNLTMNVKNRFTGFGRA